MKINNFITVFALLFTVSVLSSCSKSTAKTSETEQSTTANSQTTPTIKKVDTNTFQSEISGKKVQLVDVRTPAEFKLGHIENASNINVKSNDFLTKMTKFNKDEPVYVYCRSGGRSMRAANILKAEGFNVVNLNGGFMGWERSGFKTVK